MPLFYSQVCSITVMARNLTLVAYLVDISENGVNVELLSVDRILECLFVHLLILACPHF